MEPHQQDEEIHHVVIIKHDGMLLLWDKLDGYLAKGYATTTDVRLNVNKINQWFIVTCPCTNTPSYDVMYAPQ